MKKERLIKTIALVIVVLFIISGVVSAFNVEKESRSLKNGSWFYVGGSGEGNYSRIQDAIDNASDGDTVFVYDESSPYFETIILNKQISLIGENRNTTIIDGNETGGHIIQISSGYSFVSEFTIQNSGGVSNAACIFINSDFNQVTNNVISCIPHHGEEAIWVNQANNNIITDNTIAHHHYGIWLEDSLYNTISNNFVTDNWDWAVILGDSNNNNLSENNIIDNNGGIYLRDSKENTLMLNKIYNNYRGLFLCDQESICSQNVITQNNFKNNRKYDASFHLARGSKARNSWDYNFWNMLLIRPKCIVGTREMFLIPGIPFHFPGLMINMPWLVFDTHPVKEPYDIPKLEYNLN